MPGYGPQPEKKLHANRRGTTFWADGQGPLLMQASNPIWNNMDQDAHTQLKHAFGHNMSGERVSAYEYQKVNHLSSKWLKAHTIIRVPKVFVFSPVCNWAEAWERCTFQFDLQVIGTSLCTPGSQFGTYYQVSQWNYDAEAMSSEASGKAELKQHGQQVICTLENVWAKTQKKMYEAFEAAQKMLLASPNGPIYSMLIPWSPPVQYQVEFQHDYLDVVKGPGDWVQPMLPQWLFPTVFTPYNHPDTENEKNNQGPNYLGAAALACPRPGFGTNVLHCYAGHWAQCAGASSFAHEFAPVTPAGIQVGSLVLTNYLSHQLQLLAGRRFPWRDCGYAYGYTASDLLDYYENSYTASAEQYKANYYKYRGFGLRLFNFSKKQEFNWNPRKIWDDQLSYTAPGFFQSYEDPCDVPINFCDPFEGCYSGAFYCGGGGEGDNGGFTIVDDDINYGFHTYSVLRNFMYRSGVEDWFPAIRRRIEDYYDGIPSGTENFMRGVIARTNLGEYNVEYVGGAEGKMDNAGAMVEYVREYFNHHNS